MTITCSISRYAEMFNLCFRRVDAGEVELMQIRPSRQELMVVYDMVKTALSE